MKLWNIGAEGQFILGAFGASVVVLTPLLPAETPRWIFIPVMMLAGMLAGALWGLIPGFLKARYNVNEIISTLMMNYIAVSWNNFFIFAVWSEGGFQMTPKFPQNAWLPRLLDYAAQFPGLRGLTTHLGLVLASLAVVFVWFILYRSRWGYEIRLIGDNPRAARYAGHQHRPQHHPGDDGFRRVWPGWRGMSEDHRRGAPPADLAISPRIRLHRHHRRLAGQAQPLLP